MSDSFCMIPAKGDPSVASLKEENATLKAELEKQQQQLVNMEAALKARQEQDQQLRDSIMVARKEVRLSFHSHFPRCGSPCFRDSPSCYPTKQRSSYSCSHLSRLRLIAP